MHAVNAQPLAISYSGGDLDRADALRKDPVWVAEQRARADARVVPLWRDQLFVDADHAISLVNHALFDVASDVVLLGLRDAVPFFAADLSPLDRPDALARIGRGELVDLRVAVHSIAGHDASIAGYARSILFWHRHQHFCSTCGHPAVSARGGHMRLCTHEPCGRELFPIVTPAVIMLVERRMDDGSRACLLGHHGRLPRGAYSTLAGFVSPGETLEEAVAREVLEETNIRVGQTTYIASQPWPFPSSIMLGFRAVATTFDITVDPEELDEARWFTEDEVRAFGEWGDEHAALRLPRRDSIARALVDSWLGER